MGYFITDIETTGHGLAATFYETCCTKPVTVTFDSTVERLGSKIGAWIADNPCPTHGEQQ